MWRIKNLYWIRDKSGNRIKFQPNWAQEEILNSLHTCELVLKCRQIGITTLFNIIQLDRVLFTPNCHCGIIAQTLEDAKDIFEKKLKYAYQQLDPAIKPFFKLVGDSKSELAFAHGSSIRVGTSLRSATLQGLHISEMGKVAARDPERAREIMTGALNTVAVGQSIYVESTAEGREGAFYEMSQQAEKLVGTSLGPLDYKFRFFPWHKHPEYLLDRQILIPQHLSEYFDKLYLMGIKLSDPQKWWYVKKYETQQEDMTREYPSFPDEAFSASQEGYWYATQMKEIRQAGRITNVSYDRAIPVHTAWDLGQGDYTAIWFFQINRSGDINLIDYFQRSDCPVDMIASILKQKGYSYGTHIWPHDANARDRAGMTFVRQAEPFGIQGIVLEQHALRDGINKVRAGLSKCWFDAKKCHEGINALESYKKRWNSAIGGFTGEEVHDKASHGAAAMRYLFAGIDLIQDKGSVADDFKAIRKYWG